MKFFFQFLLRVKYQLACLIFFFLLTMVVCKVSHYMCEMRGINNRTLVKKINKEGSRVECTHLLCTLG
jgi:hypothetical protein